MMRHSGWKRRTCLRDLPFVILIISLEIVSTGTVIPRAHAQSIEDQVKLAWSSVSQKLVNRSIWIQSVVTPYSPEGNSAAAQVTAVHALKSRQDCFLSLGTNSVAADGPDGQVVARNSDYLFELKRQSGHPEWFLADICPVSALKESNPHRLEKFCHMIESDCILVPWSYVLQEGIMRKIVEGELPIKVKSSQENGLPTHVSIVAQKDDEISSDGVSRKVLRTIEFSVDPSNYFLPLSILDDYGGIMKREITFTEWNQVAGVSVPFQCKVRVLPTDFIYSVYTVTDISKGTPSKSEFRLPAFGIKEPDFIRRQPSLLTIIAGTALSACFLFWLYRVTRQASGKRFIG